MRVEHKSSLEQIQRFAIGSRYLVMDAGGNVLFSSPVPKAQVSFSNPNLSFVSSRRCRKLFTFSSSPPEPLGQFQPNLAQCIIC